MSLDEKPVVIYVEDDEDDQELCRFALEESDTSVDLRFISKGQDALDYIDSLLEDEQGENYPSLFILDLNMPAINGWDILKKLRSHKELASVPAVVFTTSISPRDREAAYKGGANAYMVKPAGLAELQSCLGVTLKYWTECVVR